MTVREAENMYTPLEYNVSYKDTLYRICYRIYKSLDNDLLQALVLFNKRYDWVKMKPGTKVRYLPEEVMRQIV